MIAIVLAAILGGSVTFYVWAPHGIILAGVLAPLGGSIAGAIAALDIASKNPE